MEKVCLAPGHRAGQIAASFIIMICISLMFIFTTAIACNSGVALPPVTAVTAVGCDVFTHVSFWGLESNTFI